MKIKLYFEAEMDLEDFLANIHISKGVSITEDTLTFPVQDVIDYFNKSADVGYISDYYKTHKLVKIEANEDETD